MLWLVGLVWRSVGDEDVVQIRNARHGVVVDDITQALRTAEDIDQDLASVLKRAEDGEFGTGDETTVAAAAGTVDPASPCLNRQ